ncbi:MAG: Periplasmic aromatic aldehyde oxidoreductase, molybdenum binding subunit YagR [uncultured Pyrinomonadaceae bacterium]|uniref:Periplasmic aromatic aldehyde oxidoreductase, molybdenum binding subunit YagR n=1 Tax=uncultured Pyrinomonadaceae bacterium TaxID=2283094 RepID=A0A6J4PFG3_9BACT|nr:MAG: Periplasmic aromatic aldehyde oxidoreductase, molybdenum binding subunit YagR [uncultured Pyrinomonadaceae bacterium]
MAEIGKPINRIDGRLKVTGAAKYAAEFNQPQMAYAFPVRSTIANGTIRKLDTSQAQASPGVISILTHENAPRLKPFSREQLRTLGTNVGEDLVVLQDIRVHYFGQFIACVVAETYEQARHAANLVEAEYAEEKPKIDLSEELPNGLRPEKKAYGPEAQLNTGKAAEPLRAAPIKFEQIYKTSYETHNPMEPNGSVAWWDGADKLTIQESTQGVLTERAVIAYYFDLKPENVRVVSRFTGGGFGNKAFPWTSNVLAVMAAKVAKRPVKLVITRQMMQTNVGRRGETVQTVALGAEKNGRLTVMRHHNETYAKLTNFFEPSGETSEILYNTPLREITYKVAELNLGAPTYMRAPGESPGSFAAESAMDELAYELKIDPINLRVMNHTTVHPQKKLPFSSEYLKECYRTGAAKFGWARRKIEPRQVRNGRYLVGYGMAAATYPGERGTATVRIQMTADGGVKVLCATHDIGTGTYTILAQTAADALGVPIGKITVEIGDSNLPPAPLSSGARTAATVGPAVQAAGEALRRDLLHLTLAGKQSKLNGKKADEIDFSNAKFFVRSDASKTDSYIDIMRRNDRTMMESCMTTVPDAAKSPSESCLIAPTSREENKNEEKYAFHSFGAQFAEVWVDEDLGTIRVKRITSVQDVGRIMNEKTARSQIIGGVIFGIGSALMEESQFDKRWANPVTRTLADYHVPVNLDVTEIDVHFIGKPDPRISPIGARGVGEIGIVGISAAIANAVFNATGKRLRDLPFTPDKLI